MKLVIFDYKTNYDLNHEVLYVNADIIARDGLYVVVEKIKEFNPDLLIEQEKNDGRAIYTEVYNRLPGIPKAWWCIDAHCNLIDHVVYAKQFDYVFCAQSWFIPIIQREVLNRVFYLPLCHTQTLTEYEAMLKTPVTKDIELSFIGNIRSIHVDRRKHVAKLQEMYPSFFIGRSDYEHTLTYLRRSKVTFNCSLNNDLNFRVFEALACGAILLTDEVSDIYSIFMLRDYIVTYDKLLPDWNIKETPRVGAEEFIKHSHTLTHRINQMIFMIEKGEQYEY